MKPQAKQARLLILAALFLLPFSKSAGEYGMAAALVLWLAGKIQRREKIFSLSPQSICYLLLLFIVLASVFYAPPENLRESVRGFFKWIRYIGFFFMTADLYKEEKPARDLLTTFLVSMALVGINGLVQMWRGTDLIKHYSADVPGRLTRMTSSFGSPNDLAAFLLLALPMAFYFWKEEEQWSKKSIGLVILLAALWAAFSLTLSRGAFFALVLALAAYLVLRRKTLLLAVMLLPATAIFVLSSHTLAENFMAVRNWDRTIGERLRYWHITWEMIKDRPWFGHGVNTYYETFAVFAPETEKYRGYAHNCYLQLWSELGLFGLLAFLIPLLYGLWRARPRRGETSGLKTTLFIGLLAFSIQATVDTNFYAMQTAYLFWIFWGVLHSKEG